MKGEGKDENGMEPERDEIDPVMNPEGEPQKEME